MTFRVKDAYEGSHILLTGGTGFLGKAMTEKLLWQLPGIERIYLMIRHRKGKEPKDRLAGLIHDPIFTRLHSECPEVFDKLTVVPGDMMKDDLGMSDEDLDTIINKVSIVIHSAATVRFDDHLKEAVTMNVIGTTRIVALCHKIKNLKVLAHVSTAYANCDRFETIERIYKSPIPPKKLIETVSWMDDELIAMITPKVLGLRPNTYTLTKALAESTIQSDAKDLPVVIIRPSIVGAMWQGPLPGWTDNINGPTGIFTAVGRGVLTNMCGSNESKADIIPVDIVANMIIVAAAHRTTITPHEIPVIHCSSGELNPLQWGHIVVFLDAFYRKYPLKESVGVPATYFHKTRYFFLFNYYVKHHLPAAIADIFENIQLKRSKYVRLYFKVWKMIETLHFFTTRGWHFEAEKMPELFDAMTKEDQRDFNFDIRQVNWDSYLFDYCMGIKKYILKESEDDLEYARALLRKQRITRQAYFAAFYAGVVFLIGRKWKRTTKIVTWLSAVIATFSYAEVNFRKHIPMKSLEEYTQTTDYTRFLKRS
ncbi:hypothetical protein CAEBREN_13113 [Caenorhabditis brenneri]|uniref:Fatty acyl-CoA reductase n=1 Tax=Caenorhabditis brenneri TaxID=135651 RepID=G0M6Z1_CAEBE|nr:hypothetical protein CAEBREN_13113 [Caenorhabditis brenneri]